MWENWVLLWCHLSMLTLTFLSELKKKELKRMWVYIIRSHTLLQKNPLVAKWKKTLRHVKRLLQ